MPTKKDDNSTRATRTSENSSARVTVVAAQAKKNGGTKTSSSSSTTSTKHAAQPSKSKFTSPPIRTSKAQVYKDTPLNRQLHRVGKPLGTQKQTHYVDNPYNRKHNRVGKKIEKIATRNYDTIIEQILKGLKDKSISDMKDLTMNDMETEVQRFVENEKKHQKTVRNVIESGKDPVPLYTDLSLFQGRIQMIKYDDLAVGKMAGAGATARVYVATLKKNIVAVKQMNTQVDETMFKREALLMGDLNHINVVKLLAAIENPRCLVMEYVHDNMFNAMFLHQYQFNTEQLQDTACGMSSGLAYLHQKEVAHCDIKAMNVLLQYSLLEPENDVFNNYKITAKLADFGLSRFCTNQTSPYRLDKGGIFGTLRYMPPEVMKGDKLTLKQRYKADVYSLGLVLVELYSQQRIFKDIKNNEIKRVVCDAEYNHPVPDKIMESHMQILVKRCLLRDSAHRPDAEEMVHHINYGDQNSSTVQIFN